MDNLEGLKAIYTALGGSAAIPAGATNGDVLALIATQAAAVKTAAETKELPTVTISNNGQVLTVDGGKWKAKALPSET